MFVSDLINLFVAPFWKYLHIYFLSPYLVLFATSVCNICFVLSHLFVISICILFDLLKFCWPTWNSLTKILLWYGQNLKCTTFVIKATNLLVLTSCKHMPEEKHWVSNDSMTSTNVHFYKFCLQFLAYYYLRGRSQTTFTRGGG